MSVVFISYSHTDATTADAIVAALDEVGVPSFRDVKDISWGDAISQSVREGLDRAAAVIVILSPGSLKSHWVSYEVGYATAKNRRVLPYLTHPALDAPGFIGDLKHVASPVEVKEFFESNPNWAEGVTGESEAAAKEDVRSVFGKASKMMPDLLADMKNDLSGDNPFTREFLPLEPGVIFNHTEPRFEYRTDSHDHLFNKVGMLESLGLISACHVGKHFKIYRFGEAFVDLLLEWKPPSGS